MSLTDCPSTCHSSRHLGTPLSCREACWVTHHPPGHLACSQTDELARTDGHCSQTREQQCLLSSSMTCCNYVCTYAWALTSRTRQNHRRAKAASHYFTPYTWHMQQRYLDAWGASDQGCSANWCKGSFPISLPPFGHRQYIISSRPVQRYTFGTVYYTVRSPS